MKVDVMKYGKKLNELFPQFNDEASEWLKSHERKYLTKTEYNTPKDIGDMMLYAVAELWWTEDWQGADDTLYQAFEHEGTVDYDALAFMAAWTPCTYFHPSWYDADFFKTWTEYILNVDGLWEDEDSDIRRLYNDEQMKVAESATKYYNFGIMITEQFEMVKDNIDKVPGQIREIDNQIQNALTDYLENVTDLETCNEIIIQLKSMRNEYFKLMEK